jgi:putative heme transporter
MLTPEQRRRRRLVVRSVLGAVVVGALFFGVLPQVADLSSVWTHIGTMSVMQLSTLSAVAIGSLLAYGLVLMAVMPGLTFAQATVVSQSSTAVANTMPAGGALAVGVSYRFYGSWGFTNAAITRNVVVTGIWNVFSKLALPVIALVLLVATGGGGNGVVAAAIVGVIVLVLAVALGGLTLSSEHAAHRIGDAVGALVVRVGRRFHRIYPPNGGDVAVRFRRDTIGLLRQRGLKLTGAIVLSQLSIFVVLLFSLRAVGVTAGDVSWIEVLAAYAATRLASTVPITPGGIGLVELGLAGTLIAMGGVEAPVIAGVLVFRMLSFFVSVPLGLGMFVVWKKMVRWRQPVPATAMA